MSNLETNCPLDIDAIHARLVKLGPPCWNNPTRERAAIAAVVADPVAGLAALTERDCCWVLARLLGRKERVLWARRCTERAASDSYAAPAAYTDADADADAASAALATYAADIAAATAAAAADSSAAAAAAAAASKAAEREAQVSHALELLGWQA